VGCFEFMCALSRFPMGTITIIAMATQRKLRAVSYIRTSSCIVRTARRLLRCFFLRGQSPL
jgi:hypothetical protein